MTRFSKRQYFRGKFDGWFDAALKRSDKRPSNAVLDNLARFFQIELNRADNAEFKRSGAIPLFKQRDVSPAAFLEEKVGRITRLAAQMIPAIDDLENNFGGYTWPYPQGDIHLDDVRRLVSQLAYFAGPQRVDGQPHRGQPSVPWRAAANNFCLAVRRSMEDVGHKRRLSLTNPDSIPVIVGAEAISWAYGKRVTTAGLVSAMRDRKRGKEVAAQKSIVHNRWNKDSNKA